MDLVRSSQEPLKQYLQQVSAAQSCVLVVDEAVLELVSTCFADLLNDTNVRNIASLADIYSESKLLNDILCKDIGGTALVLALITSHKGELQLDRIRKLFPSNVAFKAASFTVQPGYDFVPMCIVARAPAIFTLTTDTCFGPLPAFVGSSKAGPYELELETDMSAEYRAKLKRIATCLAVAVSTQLGVDVSEAVYSVGFGGSLVANTLAAHLSDIEHTTAARQKASLLILDRLTDIYTPLNDDAKLREVFQAHTEMILSGQVESVPAHILQLVEAKAISGNKALGLLLRAASMSGSSWTVDSVNSLAHYLNVNGSNLTKLCLDIAMVRKDCLNDKKLTRADEWFTGTQIGNVSVFERLIRQALDPNDSFPVALHHAHKFDVTNVARNIFGSVFGGSESVSVKQRDAEIRRRPCLIVFVLGGLSESEARSLIETALVDYHLQDVVVGGTRLFSQAEFEHELFRNIKDAPLQPQVESHATIQSKSRDFGGLFST